MVRKYVTIKGKKTDDGSAIFQFERVSAKIPFGLRPRKKNLERIGVHDGMGDRSPNQLLAELTAH